MLLYGIGGGGWFCLLGRGRGRGEGEVVHFYNNLYQEEEVWRPTVDGLDLDLIKEDDKALLEQKFKKDSGG